MAHALRQPALQPEGKFEHSFSHTVFTTYADSDGLHQQLVRSGETAEQRVAFVIGSGSHAFGYLVRVGDHLFQSPISYYTQRQAWGMAPGYELDPHPDFSRPVPIACLLCHSGKPDAIGDTLNRYQTRAFSAEGISCERCHGSAAEHVRRPVPGSILNPAKLRGSRRDSICEQCHLAGEIRILNPGKELADFAPGETLEETFTTYVRAQPSSGSIKVVSHAEQLAMSACSRNSDGRMWCGTCHDPHQTVTRPAEYFRARCLGCHASTLERAHAAEGRNCIACHMPRRATTDGGHAVFTDHRIARFPETPAERSKDFDLKAWREPKTEFRERNLGLALADFGTQKQSAPQMVEAFRLLYRIEGNFPNDPPVQTALASLLFIAQQNNDAEKRFRQAVVLKPDFAPYQINLAAALFKEGKVSEAKQYLEKALQLDPLLESGIQMLSRIYRGSGEKEKAEALLARYRAAMGYKH